MTSKETNSQTTAQISNLGNMLEKLIILDRENLDIIKWASPVPYFGNPAESEVATVGLNPSNREFVDASGRELSGNTRRFETLLSLNIESWALAQADHLDLIYRSCTDYFFKNPYDGWFKSLDAIISGTETSFYSSLFKACHLDLIPYATHSKWANLSLTQRLELLKISGAFLAHSIQSSPIKILVLNGRTVVDTLSAMAGVVFEKENQTSWTLPRKNGEGIKGISYTGTISKISNIDIGREIFVFGYNHNIQSSYGVTNKVRFEIQSWIADKARSVLQCQDRETIRREYK